MDISSFQIASGPAVWYMCNNEYTRLSQVVIQFSLVSNTSY